MIDIIKFDSDTPGPHVLMFGAIHGNETCGSKALQRLAAEIENRRITLYKGTLTLVPICNPEAYRRNVRYVEKNLNRIFAKMESPDCYEAQLANMLTALVDQADILLDLHSITAEGQPFVCLDWPDHPKHREFAHILGISSMVQGWADLYTDPNPGYSGDTVTYAVKNGKNAVVLECGQHMDPKAPEVGYRAALNTLDFYGLTNRPPPVPVTAEPLTILSFVRKDKPGQFARPWRNLDLIKEGELIAIADDGIELRAPMPMRILMPKKNALLGEEWYYMVTPEADHTASHKSKS